MTDDVEKGSLVTIGDLSGLSKPAIRLVEKVSEAFGGALRPWQIRRVAAAEADAAILKAEGVAEVAKVKALAKLALEEEVEERAMRRILAQETKRQKNIESILNEATQSVSPEAKPEAIDDDWMDLFLEHSKMVSNKQMQQVWGKLLVGEANKPGQFSRRTLEIVANMSKTDAESFVDLSRFVARDFEGGTAVVYEPDSPANRPFNIGSNALSHLESFGLIKVLD